MSAIPAEAHLHVNGVDATTGTSLVPPIPIDAIAAMAAGERPDPRVARELRAKHAAATVDHLGVVAGVDPLDLSSAGWAVLFAHDTDPGVRDALSSLLEHRRGMASAHDERLYREFWGAAGYRPGETSAAFLVRYGVGIGQPADPVKMPYYILIVGDADAIPYGFQYQLDVVYATGRVSFDRLDDYERYARHVVRAETEPATGAPSVALVGARNDGDPATRLSADHLVAPLGARLARRTGLGVETHVGDAARKARLLDLVGAGRPPRVLFAAMHGLGFPAGDPRQYARQGALVCQDWPGPQAHAPVSDDHCLAGEDIGSDTAPNAAITMLFACFGAGTPTSDGYTLALERGRTIAHRSFVAGLPRRLLSHPRGGTLAVVGHVDRAWSYSFTWPRAGEQLEVFSSALEQIVAGAPVGYAMEYFNNRYAALATELEAERESIAYGKPPDPEWLAGLWTARNDARDYVVIGDPAARIRRP